MTSPLAPSRTPTAVTLAFAAAIVAFALVVVCLARPILLLFLAQHADAFGALPYVRDILGLLVVTAASWRLVGLTYRANRAGSYPADSQRRIAIAAGWGAFGGLIPPLLNLATTFLVTDPVLRDPWGVAYSVAFLVIPVAVFAFWNAQKYSTAASPA